MGILKFNFHLSSTNKKLKNSNKVILKQNKIAKWAKENKVAIEEYNERIRKHGGFSDSFRSF